MSTFLDAVIMEMYRLCDQVHWQRHMCKLCQCNKYWSIGIKNNKYCIQVATKWFYCSGVAVSAAGANNSSCSCRSFMLGLFAFFQLGWSTSPLCCSTLSPWPSLHPDLSPFLSLSLCSSSPPLQFFLSSCQWLAALWLRRDFTVGWTIELIVQTPVKLLHMWVWFWLPNGGRLASAAVVWSCCGCNPSYSGSFDGKNSKINQRMSLTVDWIFSLYCLPSGWSAHCVLASIETHWWASEQELGKYFLHEQNKLHKGFYSCKQ